MKEHFNNFKSDYHAVISDRVLVHYNFPNINPFSFIVSVFFPYIKAHSITSPPSDFNSYGQVN